MIILECIRFLQYISLDLETSLKANIVRCNGVILLR